MVEYVAFFRDLNQGQRGSPTSGVLEQVFREVGATSVALYRSNGTVRFASEAPDACAQAAAELVIERSGWDDVYFVRPLAELQALAHDFVSQDPDELRRTELSLFDPALAFAGKLAGRRCRVVSGGAGFAVTLNDRDGISDATPTLERALNTRVTSRGLPTILGLVAKR